MSAPLKPRMALIMSSVLTLLSFMFLVCILNISLMPSSSGRGTSMSLSSRPGRIMAGSRMSFRFVHPMILTLSKCLNPSISESSCMNVRCTSRSPEVPMSILVAAMASNSSMKTIDGACSRASWNISLTSFAPSPMNFCTSSLPTTSMNVELVDAATAFARRVFPVPGSPWRSIPFGGCIPTFSKSFGFLRGSSMTSLISSVSFCSPPMCSQGVFGFSTITKRSTSNDFCVSSFLTMVRFFCSTATPSPMPSLPMLAEVLTRNSLPFGSLMMDWFSGRIDFISQTRRGVFLNLSSSRSRLNTVSLRIRFSSSTPEMFVM